MLTFSLNPSMAVIMNPKYYCRKVDNDFEREGLSEAYWKSISGHEGYNGENDNLEALGKVIRENEMMVKNRKEVNLISKNENEAGHKGFVDIALTDGVSAYDDANGLLDLADKDEEYNIIRDAIIIENGIDISRLIKKALGGNKTAIQKLGKLVVEQNIAELVQDIILSPFGKAIIDGSIAEVKVRPAQTQASVSGAFSKKENCA